MPRLVTASASPKPPELPLNALRAISEEEASTAPAVPVEREMNAPAVLGVEEAIIPPPTVVLSSEENDHTLSSKVERLARPSKMAEKRSEPADRRKASEATTHSATRRSAVSTATTTWKTELCESDSEAVTPIATATTWKTDHDLSESPFLWHLTDQRMHNLMLAMETADTMPHEGSVYRSSSAQERYRTQYAVFLAAWQYVFPYDPVYKLPSRFSSWLNDIKRHIPDGQEGEHLLLILFGTVMETQEAGIAIDSPKGIVNRAVLDTVRFDEAPPPTKSQKLKQHRQRKAIQRKEAE